MRLMEIGGYSVFDREDTGALGNDRYVVENEGGRVFSMDTAIGAAYAAHAMALAATLTPDQMLGGRRSPLSFMQARDALHAFCRGIP